MIEGYRQSLVVHQVEIPGFRFCVTLEAHTNLSPSGQHFSVEKEICIPILVSRCGDIETFKASRGLVHQREVEIGRERVCDA